MYSFTEIEIHDSVPLTDVIERVMYVQSLDEIERQKVTKRPSARQLVAYKKKKHRFLRCFFRWILDLGSNQGPTELTAYVAVNLCNKNIWLQRYLGGVQPNV